MKKITLASLLAASVIALSGAAYAADNGSYTGPASNMVTVEAIQGLNDDTFVILKGNITQTLGDEMYVFTDSTGSINVEIDDDQWNGQNVNADNWIIIKGQVDKSGNNIEIDVDEVTMVN